jgi:hypothetical protein
MKTFLHFSKQHPIFGLKLMAYRTVMNTLKKKKTKFSTGNSDGIGCKIIYEEGLPKI